MTPRASAPTNAGPPLAARVRVPASTSNLGPGFDLLGLALSVWLDVRVERARDEADAPTLGARDGSARDWPEGADNLLLRAWHAAAPAARGVVLSARSEIPLARGLGSSGAAVAAGLLLGAAWASNDEAIDPHALHARGIALEGHPDNVTASLFGGLTLCHPDPRGDGRPLLVKERVHPDLAVGLAWPARALATRDARRVLPASVPFADAVENPRRLALLLAGLRSADPERIACGLEERLHERHRLPLIPGAAAALAAAREAGAYGACISGSGSALVALGPRARIAAAAEAMADAFRAAGETAEARVVEVVSDAPRVQLEHG